MRRASEKCIDGSLIRRPPHAQILSCSHGENLGSKEIPHDWEIKSGRGGPEYSKTLLF